MYDQVKTIFDQQVGDDDRVWIKQIPEDQLQTLLWVPHEYTRDVLGYTLADAFTIIYNDRPAGPTASSFVSSVGEVISDGLLVSGVDGTGYLMIEGPAQPSNRDPGGGSLPVSAKGHEGALSAVSAGRFLGVIHGDTGDNCFRAAEILVMAIRYRGQLGRLLSSQRYAMKVDRRDGTPPSAIADATCSVTFDDDPTIFYHGSKADMMYSCYHGKSSGMTLPAPGVPFNITLKSFGVKSPNRV